MNLPLTPLHDRTGETDFALRHPLVTGMALSLAAAIALGLTRFSYGPLLPPMREDLGWSYLLAGAMHTANALGYLLGALGAPLLLRRWPAWHCLMVSATVASLLMLLSGISLNTHWLLAQRAASGLVSALVFIAGGLLAAQLGGRHSGRSGLLIGLYYGGTGLGIAVSALLVPAAITAALQQGAAHAWQWAWLALGAASVLAVLLMAFPSKAIGRNTPASASPQPLALKPFGSALACYFLFGIGSIGYMTFVVALLQAQGMQPGLVTSFYALLGLAVMAASRIWARMFERFKGGESLALLNALLALATLVPAVTSAVPWVLASGVLFGSVFLAVVAATTVLVRHNLPPAAWPAGIGAFTVAFALGQVLGPALVGSIADGPGGLERGLVVSASVLLLAALLASRQKPLQPL